MIMDEITVNRRLMSVMAWDLCITLRLSLDPHQLSWMCLCCSGGIVVSHMSQLDA